MSWTAILILNWNGSEDTLTCLRSLIPNLASTDYLFVIDNGSTDNSVAVIEEYFHSAQLSLVTLGGEELKRNFNPQQKNYCITNFKNLGFGGGNNVALSQLNQLDANFEFAWLLNNDTVVDPLALSSLQKVMSDDKGVGAAGSLLLNYPDNDLIQCTGVRYYKFFGVSKLINKNSPYKKFNKRETIDFDYLNGASLLLNLEALKTVGYFDERFFLYSEELDLELRLKKNNYRLVLDTESIVHHKLGGGTNRKKYLFYYYYNTSAILLSKKHFNFFFTFCVIINLTAITFIRTFPSFKSLKWGIKGILTGLR